MQGTEEQPLIFQHPDRSPDPGHHGSTHDLSLEVFAGPLERELLEDEQPYAALNVRPD